MDYKEYLDYVQKNIEKMMDGEAKVIIKTMISNNDYERDAILILKDNSRIVPSIYLADFYDAYIKGQNIDDNVLDIYCAYERHQINEDISFDFFKEYSRVKDNIAYKLVNKEKNKKLLEDVPYVEYLDLAIVFYMSVNTDFIKNAAILIHNNHLDMWNITKEELYNHAMENTPRLLKSTIVDMQSMIKNLINNVKQDNLSIDKNDVACEYAMDISELSDPGMYVLTNEEKIYGAACILYDDVLKQHGDALNTDFYIIPSSVHEVILIPVDYMNREYIDDMIKQVNREELRENEVLSDHAYIYHRKTNEITIE